MTTQAMTVGQRKNAVRALIGATVFTVAVLGGAALWQVRPGGHVAVPATSATVGTISEGATPLGGLAERYRDEVREAAALREARVTTMGGMAELYRDQVAARSAAAEGTAGHLGGMAELYRDLAAASSR
jgi:hypothetical protein